jgi:cell wall-associated NlpC family hydrolase
VYERLAYERLSIERVAGTISQARHASRAHRDGHPTDAPLVPSIGSERGQAAVAAVGLLLVLVLCAVGAGIVLRASLTRQRAAGTADGAALAAAAVLRDRADDLLPRHDPRTHRALAPLLTRRELDELARRAADSAARVGGARLLALATSDGARGLPLYATVTVEVAGGALPRWLGASTLEQLRTARARAGVEYPVPEAVPDRFRAVDLGGVAGIAAVVAAAGAQLGWPYLWGGESRAEGGFDCSGLIDYALAAAGFPVGRPTAAGLQSLAQPVPLPSVQAGDLVFVGFPAHHVGLVVRPGLAIEAPHRGAVVHYEALADGGWTSAGRIAALAAAPSVGGDLPDWVPQSLRADLIAASRAESLPAALLAAQIEAESGFDARAVSDVGALGLAQFMPGTWRGSWNPWRAQSPFDATAAIDAQARYLRRLVDRAGGDLARALAAYHDGWEGSAGRRWSAGTRAYVAAILRRVGGSPAVPVMPGAEGMRAPAGVSAVVRLVSLEAPTPNGGFRGRATQAPVHASRYAATRLVSSNRLASARSFSSRGGSSSR